MTVLLFLNETCHDFLNREKARKNDTVLPPKNFEGEFFRSVLISIYGCFAKVLIH